MSSVHGAVLHVRTPLWPSQPLSVALGAEVRLKMEALQPVGSFKIRGIGRACQQLAGRGTRHFVSSSGGNAGYAVAYAGRQLGVPVTVIVPRTTPEFMRRVLRATGAEVREHGASWDDAHAAAAELASAGGALIHPFDDETVWAGHATLIEECADQWPAAPDAIVVAVGGGGLLLGVLEGCARVGWDTVPILAVETEGAASLAASLRRGELVTLPRIESIAITLGARTVAPRALVRAQQRGVTSHLVDDRAAVASCARFAEDHRLLVEPACGAALAACYDRAPALRAARRVLVVVCGGAAATPELLAHWLRVTAGGR